MLVLPLLPLLPLSEMFVCVATFPFTVCVTVAAMAGADAAAAAANTAGLVTSGAAIC